MLVLDQLATAYSNMTLDLTLSIASVDSNTVAMCLGSENGDCQCQRIRQGMDGNADSSQIDACLDYN